jgi:hypothetical protein
MENNVDEKKVVLELTEEECTALLAAINNYISERSHDGYRKDLLLLASVRTRIGKGKE